MNPRAQTIILPRPVTLSSLGTLLALSKTGIVHSQASLRLTQQRPSQDTSIFQAENRVVNLLVSSVHNKAIREIVEQTSPIIRRWINWLHFGSNSTHDTLAYTIDQIQKRCWMDGQGIALRFTDWVTRHSHIDPWTGKLPWINDIETRLSGTTTATGISTTTELPGDKRFIHLPYFRKDSGFTTIRSPNEDGTSSELRRDPALPDSEVAGTLQVRLAESNVLQIVGSSIAIGVGGLPNSGKSTLCVSLAQEMEAVLRSLETRTGWPKFKITVGVANLDLATPTAEAIAGGDGQHHAGLVALKRKWSLELAEEARIVLEKARKKYTIVLCDLPGGNPDDITRIIAAGLDAGIIITRDWSKAMEMWPPLYKSIGVKIVSRIRSRLPHEGFSSLATHHRPGERISGRVSGLFRSTKAWDRFIEYLALFLLFEILPNLYGYIPSSNPDQTETRATS